MLKNPVTIWWIRHGPTHERAFPGWRDVPADLSDSAKITRLANHLPDDAVLVSSDLIRASATADAILGSRRRLPDHRGLREFDFGAWDGKSFGEVTSSDSDLSRQFWETPGDVAPPGGESWNAVAARVNGAIDGILRGTDAGHIVAVAHIGVIMTQIQRASTGRATDAISHEIEPLSVTKIRFDGSWSVELINHCP